MFEDLDISFPPEDAPVEPLYPVSLDDLRRDPAIWLGFPESLSSRKWPGHSTERETEDERRCDQLQNKELDEISRRLIILARHPKHETYQRQRRCDDPECRIEQPRYRGRKLRTREVLGLVLED